MAGGKLLIQTLKAKEVGSTVHRQAQNSTWAEICVSRAVSFAQMGGDFYVSLYFCVLSTFSTI